MGGSVHHGVPGTRSTVSLLKLERKKIGIVTFLDNLTISKVFFVLEPFRKCMSRSVLNEMGTNQYAVGHRAEKCSLERKTKYTPAVQ